MKYEFDVGYDKITNFDAPGYDPKEISTFLTRAQESLVYEILNSSAYEEENKKAMSRLRQVIPLSTFTAGNYPNGFIASLRTFLQGGVAITFDSGNNKILDSSARFITSGFRVGDVITVNWTTTPANSRSYSIIGVTGGQLTVSPQTPVDTTEVGTTATILYGDPVLRVRNERADIALIAGNFYFDKIPVVPATEPVTYNNAILDVEVNPTDDDFYGANKDNPYKKPSIEKIWRIDSADETQKQHEYITDGTFTLTTIHLHIDRKPRPIIVPETTAVQYAVSDGTIDGIWFVDYDGVLGDPDHGIDCLLDQSVHREIVE
ncbi:MAG: hypothetical protein KAJ55_02845, partial [Anaerolineales bacterium]|nr:hypothetical protein [Anaerolineales bacterium]